MKLFNDIALVKSDFIRQNKHAKLSSLESFDIETLAVVWSYYSGRIEGNAYTYAETECLLKDNITSIKKYNDAKMLKDLYNCFITTLKLIKDRSNIAIDMATIFNICTMLTDELIQLEDRGGLREKAVSIAGTQYILPRIPDGIKQSFETILKAQQSYHNPLERACFFTLQYC